LGKSWLIKLIMTHLSVTNKINDNVLVEFLSVLSGSLEGESNIFHAISVDMENWGVNSFCKI
jgi:hypothetical protein